MEMDESSIPVVVSCAEHRNAVSNGLRKLFETKRGADLEFRWGGNCVRTHKLILELFLTPETLAQGCHDDIDGKVQPQPTISLDDTTLSEKGYGQSVDVGDCSSILDTVFEFMYNGIVTLTSVKLPELLELAKELDFCMLVDAVESVSTSEDGRQTPFPQPTVILSCVDGDISEDDMMETSMVERWERSESPLEKRVRPSRFRAATKVADAADEDQDICSEESDEEADLSAELVWDKDVQENGSTSSTDAPAEVQLKLPQGTRRKQKEVAVGKCKGNVPKEGGSDEVKLNRLPLLKCTHCDFTSHNERLFQVHQAKHGSTMTAFRCKICSQAFLNQASLDRHSIRHECHIKVDSTYICPHCPFKSQQETWFRLHLKTKHDDSSVEVYCCDSCKRPFLTASAMSHHTCVQRNGESIHACNHCEFKTSQLSIFRLHLAQHDSSDSATSGTTSFPYDISELTTFPNVKTFPNPATCSQHHWKHTLLKCPHCAFETRKSTVYHRHLYVSHNRNEHNELLGEDDKKFGCPDCPYRNSKLSQLKIHQVAKHSPVHPYKCDQCSFTSGRKGSIGRHVKWVHLGLRPEPSHMCELCGRRFVKPCELAKHKWRHTDEKPHTCELCGKHFRDLQSRRRHLLLHASNDKPFCCHICGYSCNQRYNLRGHMRRMHKASLDSQPNV